MTLAADLFIPKTVDGALRAPDLSDVKAWGTGIEALIAAKLAASEYEAGTWTPTIISNGGDNPTVTYTNQVGEYIKIGKMCYISGQVNWSATSGGTSEAAIGGLPFATKSGL